MRNRNKEQLLADMAEMERGIRDPKKTAEQKDIFRRTIANIQRELDALGAKPLTPSKAPDLTPEQEQTRRDNIARRNHAITRLGQIGGIEEKTGNGTPPTAKTGDVSQHPLPPAKSVTIIWQTKDGEKKEQYDEARLIKRFQLVFNSLARSASAKKKEYWRLPFRSPAGFARAVTYFAAMQKLHRGQLPTAGMMGATRMHVLNRKNVFLVIAEHAKTEKQ